jgi:hypothetical protein
MINKNKNLTVFLLFLLISFAFFNQIFFDEGILLGGDWSLPYSPEQIKSYFTDLSNTWWNINFGSRFIGLGMLPLAIIIKVTSLMGISGVILSKLLLLLLFIVAGFSMHKLLEFFDCKKVISIIGGVIYITTPIFFNYAIIGWFLVLLTMALLPLAVKYFIKSVEEDNFRDKIILSIIIFFSLQSQSIIWYFICFGCLSFYLIKDKASLLKYLKVMGFVVLAFFALNFYWLAGLLISQEKSITGNNMVSSGVSLGIVGHFSPKNIIRIFGSMYNFQYEYIADNSKYFYLSFVLPLLVCCSLFLKKKKKLVIAFGLVAIFPFFIYWLNFYRNILFYIPFANVIRDFARFLLISNFAYTVLACLFLSYLLAEKNKKWRIAVGYFFILLLALSAHPWWTFKVADWQAGLGPNQRLRTKVFPQEYFDVENNFANKKLDQKSLYLPIYGTVDIEDDVKFHGMYQEAQDIFAAYSPIPGVLIINDRDLGSSDNYLKVIKNNINKKLIDVLLPTSVKYIVLRKNMKMDNTEIILNNLKSNNKLYEYYDADKIIVYAKKEFLPHFYIPQKNIISQRSVESLPKILSGEDWQARSAVFFENQNPNKNTEFLKGQVEKNDEANLPVTEFKKINPTKYRIRIHGAKNEFPLIFSESFHEGWRAYVSQVKSYKDESYKVKDANINNYKILDENKEDQANDYELTDYLSRGWVTSLGNGKEKEIVHNVWEGMKEEVDYVEKYKIDFISKNFQGTIQNDNLPAGNFWETWMASKFQNNPKNKSRIFSGAGKPIELPEENHLMANGYANSWIIDVDKICSENADKCVKNADGSYDFEMVVEFWPQRLFYIGLVISGSTLLACLMFLAYDWRRKRSVAEF